MRAPHGSSDDSRPLSIGALARATRIPVETLRTWERRYGVPAPVRGASGHRRFPATAVEHLRKASKLLARGFRPGEILALQVEELDGLLALSDARPTTTAPTAAAAQRPVEPSVAQLCDAVGRYDRLALVSGLRTNWSRLGPLRFFEEVASPLLVEIGRRWEARTLDIRHEHFASSCVGDLLRELREPFDRAAAGPVVAMATLSGDLHEGGLLMAAMIVAMRGGRVLYLGTDTPIEQISAAAQEGTAELVTLGVSSTLSRPKARNEIDQLRKLVDKRVPIWVGGIGAPPNPPRGVERFASLSQLDARLAGPGGILLPA